MTGRSSDGRPLAEPRVAFRFGNAGTILWPGGLLEVTYRVEAVDPATVEAVERSVAWYTEGKGEEDLGVVFFERLTAPAGQPAVEPSGPPWPAGRFASRLPQSPLSYEGLIVKIRWCARVRLFFSGGRDFVSEQVFCVGDVPVARPLTLTVS